MWTDTNSSSTTTTTKCASTSPTATSVIPHATSTGGGGSSGSDEELSLESTCFTHLNGILTERAALPCKLCFSSVNLTGHAKVAS